MKTSSYLKYKIYIEKFTIKDIRKKPIKLAKWHLVKEVVFVEMEWGSNLEHQKRTLFPLVLASPTLPDRKGPDWLQARIGHHRADRYLKLFFKIIHF